MEGHINIIHNSALPRLRSTFAKEKKLLIQGLFLIKLELSSQMQQCSEKDFKG